MLSQFSHAWLFVTLWTIAHPAPLSIRFFQAEMLEWVALLSSRGSLWPMDWTHVSTSPGLAGGFFTTSATWETPHYHVLYIVAQSCPTLCDPMDCSPPGSSAQGDSLAKNTGVGCKAILQEIFPTQGSKPGILHCRQILYRLSHQGNPNIIIVSC